MVIIDGRNPEKMGPLESLHFKATLAVFVTLEYVTVLPCQHNDTP